jgi:hypothetical protein
MGTGTEGARRADQGSPAGRSIDTEEKSRRKLAITPG